MTSVMLATDPGVRANPQRLGSYRGQFSHFLRLRIGFNAAEVGHGGRLPAARSPSGAMITTTSGSHTPTVQIKRICIGRGNDFLARLRESRFSAAARNAVAMQSFHSG